MNFVAGTNKESTFLFLQVFPLKIYIYVKDLFEHGNTHFIEED